MSEHSGVTYGPPLGPVPWWKNWTPHTDCSGLTLAARVYGRPRRWIRRALRALRRLPLLLVPGWTPKRRCGCGRRSRQVKTHLAYIGRRHLTRLVCPDCQAEVARETRRLEDLVAEAERRAAETVISNGFRDMWP